ncbi:ThiF family adenylyltransferase [Candidatus Lokiarchaeum ossiferum]|uniref:ThiF family adenylyltransferase n=1 Tax=Candidatus Lokiarchaeum ossiferum TaxID=2951803 RepID=UPI00352F22E0
MEKNALTMDQIERYSRQILLREVGSKGMKLLLSSTVAIVGAGGLGCPIAQMLASMGVGTLKLIDGDHVELTNLPRQPMHYTSDIGKFKVDSLMEKIGDMNPDVKLIPIKKFLDKDNIQEILEGCDYVLDASDNIATKFLINDACIYFNIPFTIAGVVQWFGQLVSVIPGKTTCYRCIFRNLSEPDETTSCSGAGVMGTIPTFAGVLQANEAVKFLLGLPLKFINGMFSFDLLMSSFDLIQILKDKSCKACSDPHFAYYETEDYGVSLNSRKSKVCPL